MIGYLNLSNWRYERKFFISELSKYEIESIVRLHPAIFSEIYHERIVNNIYFDTFNMANYFENIEGISQRLKIRIRWYGKSFGIIEKPVLELKIKKGQLGNKLHYPLDSFCLDKYLTNDNILEIINTAKIPNEIKQIMKSFNIILLNRYTRKYFQSVDKKFRVTIDTDMQVTQLSHLYNSFSNRISNHMHNILELKYSDESDDYAKMVTNSFPFRVTKSSKYVTGVERLNP